MPLVTTAEQVASTTVRYTWSGTAPYDMWLNGEKLLAGTLATSFIVDYSDGEAEPWIEVLDADDTEPAQSEQYGPRMRLQWRGQADAEMYALQRFNPDPEEGEEEWEDKQFVREMGRGYYRSWTTPEAHGSETLWRVVAQDTREYTSPVIEYSKLTVCNPGTPVVSGDYDADTGDLTVDG